MTDQPTSEETAGARFRVGFRGYDRAEVDAHLERLGGVIADLEAERARLVGRLGDVADRDLKREFETVGREVSSVLEAARVAAEAMRERATADAARWRAEAMAEAEQMRREARADAESLRTDAWTTGSQLLDQVAAEVERQREAGDREALAVRGEAEREAHRLTSAARREADDLARASKMEAERLLSRARAEYDEIIATAQRQADAAQERTRALEERRRKLMDELESVRGMLATLEQQLEERRQGIGSSEPPELPSRVVMADERGEPKITDWEEGQTVRIIRPDSEGEFPAAAQEGTDAEQLAEEVARLHTREVDHHPVETPEGEEPPRVEPEAGVPVDEVSDEAAEGAAADGPSGEGGAVSGQIDERGRDPQVEPEAPPGTDDRSGMASLRPGEGVVDPPGRDDLADIFARLRSPSAQDHKPSPGAPVEEEAETVAAPPTVTAADPSPDVNGLDPFETRERLLLPITNSTLRTVKRGLADAQNQALEHLRVSEGEWEPDPDELQSLFRDDLESLAGQAAQAGLEAAVEMGVTGVASLTPEPAVPAELGSELAGEIRSALDSAGSGRRERQAAASRVFRGWRTDEAERRIRTVAFTAYHSALRTALETQERTWRWVPFGRLCSNCRQAAEEGSVIPPAHRDCSCTIVPV